MIQKVGPWQLAALAAVLIFAFSSTVGAQPGEGGSRGPGFGGPGGPRMMRGSSSAGMGPGSGARLASIPEVQKALKLTKEQKKEIREINDELRDGFRKLLQEGGAREGMRKVNEEAAARLAEVLDDAQEKRLRGIIIQIVGASAVMIDGELANELKITDEQKTKLEEVQRSNMQALAETFGSGNPNEDRRGKFEELRIAGQQKLFDVLTSEQQEQLNSLKGEEVKIDFMSLRGGGSGNRSRGGGQFGGRSGRQRGDRERSEREKATESESKND